MFSGHGCWTFCRLYEFMEQLNEEINSELLKLYTTMNAILMVLAQSL